MAKSARSSVKKNNNQRLKKDVFGPVEAARAERLSAKLLELAKQPKPEKEADVKMDTDEQDDGERHSGSMPYTFFFGVIPMLNIHAAQINPDEAVEEGAKKIDDSSMSYRADLCL